MRRRGERASERGADHRVERVASKLTGWKRVHIVSSMSLISVRKIGRRLGKEEAQESIGPFDVKHAIPMERTFRPSAKKGRMSSEVKGESSEGSNGRIVEKKGREKETHYSIGLGVRKRN